MGNGIWPMCQEPTQRLCKPRTNTSSSNLLSLASQQPETSSPGSPDGNSMFGEDVVTSQNGNRRSRRKSRSKIRSYLQGPANESPRAYSSEEEDSGQRGIVNDVRKSFSRRSSSLSRLAYRRRSSTQLPSASSSRLMLDEETGRMNQDSKEKEYAGGVASQNHISPSIDKEQRIDAAKSPIRRRSLYTPGLATRTPHDMLRRPPPPDRSNSQIEREYYYNPDRPQSSPLSDLAALAASRNAAIASSQDGRSTPVHLMQLGGLCLGTLRITNGTASPEPSEDLNQQPDRALTDSASHDDYFTASEGCRSEDEAHSFTSKTIDETLWQPRRAASPLKFEAQWESQPDCQVINPVNGPETFDEPRHNNDSADGLSKPKPYENPIATPRATDRASSMAQDYMLELPSSPYDLATSSRYDSHDHHPMSSAIARLDKVVSHPTSSADHCNLQEFQDEGIDLPESQARTTDLWRMFVDEAEARHANSNTTEDAYRILNGDISPRNSMVEPSNQYLSMTSGDRDDRRTSSSTIATTNTTHSGSEHTNVRTTMTGSLSLNEQDSGYNSNSSLNTAGYGTGTGAYPPGFLAGHPNGHRSISGPRDMPQQPLRGPEAYTTGSLAQTRPCLTVATRPATTVTVTTTSSPVIKRQTTAPSGNLPTSESVLSAVRSPQSPVVTPTVETSCRFPTIGPSGDRSPQQRVTNTQPSPTKNRKLQKQRRLSKPPPVDQITVQQLRDLTETSIPQVPAAIYSKHSERLRMFPSLEHTYPSSHHTSPDESRSGSPERTHVPVRFPSPTNSMEDRSDAIVNGDLDWPTKSSKKKAKDLAKDKSSRNRSRSRSRGRRKSQGEPAPSITDFGDVADFLGKGPYDIAKLGSEAKLYTPELEDRSRLNQANASMPRPKSMLGLSEEVPVIAGPCRQTDPIISRPQAPGPQDSYESRSLSGRGLRPHSMFAEISIVRPLDGLEHRHAQQDSEAHTIATTSRSYSLFAEVPPVPLLPSPSRAKKLESQARKLRESGGPEVPDVAFTDMSARESNFRERPARLARPLSMYNAATPIAPSRAQLGRAKTCVGLEDCSASAIEPQSPRDGPGMQPLQSVSSPHLERSETVIHSVPGASQAARLQTMYEHAPPMPTASTSASSQRCSQRYIDESNAHSTGKPNSEALRFISNRPLHGFHEESAMTKNNKTAAPNKLQKKRPGLAKPDLWKSDSLKDGLSKRLPEPLQGAVPTSNSDESEISSESSSIWDSTKLSWAKRRQSAGAALSANGFSVGQVPQPVAAPSIHDALRFQKGCKPKAPNASHLSTVHPNNSDSSYESVRSQAASIVQPPAFSHDSMLGNVPQVPTRNAPPPPPKSSHGTSGESQRPATSYFSNPSQPQTSQKSSQNTSPTNGSSSSPRTPKSDRKSSSKQHSPTISSPTANAADSYSSHAEAAPPPPAFSMARKRVGSLPSYMPQPSARSLKPTPVPTPTVSAASSTTSLRLPSTFSSRGTLASTNPSTPPTSSNPSTYSLPPGPINPLSAHPVHPTPQSSQLSRNPLSSPYPLYASTPPTSFPNPIAPLYPPSRFENLSGRYQGGLQYGYEPGVGLGGSAGTRGAKNGATRKSVDVSRGWGLDLSDVPVFVAPVSK